MIDFDEACRRLAGVATTRGLERTVLDAASDRVLAAPVIARQTAPEVAVSAMDGYAVRDGDLAPLLAGMTGRTPDEALIWRTAPLLASLGACGDRECFHRGRSDSEGVRPLGNQDSSAQRELARAEVLIRRRADARALDAGNLVEVLAA